MTFPRQGQNYDMSGLFNLQFKMITMEDHQYRHHTCILSITAILHNLYTRDRNNNIHIFIHLFPKNDNVHTVQITQISRTTWLWL